MGCGQVHGTSGKLFTDTVQRLTLFFLTWLGHEKLLYRSL